MAPERRPRRQRVPVNRLPRLTRDEDDARDEAARAAGGRERTGDRILRLVRVKAPDRLGIATNEVRENDRRLLFDEAGIITMRPSDVPTYVEAGAADLGITGKDVLLEHSERELYELVDLGYGHCTMVLATVAGADPAAEALRRLGVMRIATHAP